MKRYKRLYVVLAVLLAACIATFALSRYKAQKEQIQTSGETILLHLRRRGGEPLLGLRRADPVLPPGRSLELRRRRGLPGGRRADEPTSGTLRGLRRRLYHRRCGRSGAVRLDNPVCTIRITAGGETHTIQLGDYSKMDAQRYVSIGTETCTWRPTTPGRI